MENPRKSKVIHGNLKEKTYDIEGNCERDSKKMDEIMRNPRKRPGVYEIGTKKSLGN